MLRLAAWMLLGNLFVLQLSALPPGGWLALVALGALLLCVWRYPGPAAALAMAAWTGWSASQALEMRLPDTLAGQDVTVTGRVADFPRHGRVRSSFLFEVDSAPAGVPRRLQLSWYGSSRPLVPGEALTLEVRLRPPRGLANPGGSDQAGRLFRAGIGASGYVRRELAPAGPALRRDLLGVRATLATRLTEGLGEGRSVGVLLAVGLGTRHLLDGSDREILARTGTSHLMAISGLHVGLVAALGLVVFRALWAWLPGPCRRVPPLLVGAWLGLGVAAGYALLAGFAIPTRRALLMLTVVLAALCLRRPLRPGRGLALAGMVVLATDPLASLDASFWLSFLAVGVIALVFHGRIADPGRTGEDGQPAAGWGERWRRLGRGLRVFLLFQALIVIGMAPVTGLLFGQVPLVSPLANALLVPLFSLLIVPGTLLGLLVLPWAPGLALAWLGALARLLELMWTLLAQLAAAPLAVSTLPALPPVLWLALALGAWLVLLPRGWPGRWLALPLLLAVFAWRPPTPSPGAFDVWLLDVGQGLAVVVRTTRHLLVYDTGPAMPEGFDAGRAVVLPALRHLGHRRIDTLVISHGDNDHAGGLAAVRAGLPVTRLLVGGADAARLGGEPCLLGQQWHWDGVEFEMLHPASPRLRGNEGSCVLSVRGRGGSLLLTGDIEFWGESSLLAGTRALAHDVVQVPHHGSRTSSSPAFVQATAARYALVGVAHANRWGLPRPEVVARWDGIGAELLDTARLGAVELRVSAEGEIEVAGGWRERRRRFWHVD
ncbi:MAG: DNA internalization-related competence protein ComEC/Rec2 [Gammaproteobacteria bacterium]|nr:MAG: DNA internalization-related competence protein ComEC/Rec2 [Gammaproteobacteria bacterium]